MIYGQAIKCNVLEVSYSLDKGKYYYIYDVRRDIIGIIDGEGKQSRYDLDA